MAIDLIPPGVRLDGTAHCFQRPGSRRPRHEAGRDREPLAEARWRRGFGTDGRPRRQPDAWRAAFATLMEDKTAA